MYSFYEIAGDLHANNQQFSPLAYRLNMEFPMEIRTDNERNENKFWKLINF